MTNPDVSPAPYSVRVPAELHKVLDSFRAPAGTDPYGVRAGLHVAYYTLAHSIAEVLPNSDRLIEAVSSLREALDAAVSAVEE